MLLARHYEGTTTLNFTFALINALVIGKIILIGQMFHLGRRAETLPVYQSALLKSLLFGILIFLFHLVEEFIKRIIHHEPAGAVLERLDVEQLVARSIIVLVALVPLFAFRELSRVLGQSRLRTLLTQRSG
jgi:Na+-driven multidrug efflux pump